MTRMALLGGLAVLSMVSPGSAQAQDVRLASRLDSATATTVQAVVDSAVAQGIPAEPLVQKALEGKTLGAPSERIVQAVRSLRSRLVTAMDVLGPKRSVDELSAGAAALGAGVEPSVLGTLGQRLPIGSAGLPLVVLADLIQRGVTPDEASRAVVLLAEAQVDAAGYVQLRAKVEEDIHQGALPGAAVRARARGIVLRQPRGGQW